MQVTTVNALVDRIRAIHAGNRNVSRAFIRTGTVAGLRALERYAKRKCADDAAF
jgi:malonyl CoA-acyl carrier protein transacylase